MDQQGEDLKKLVAPCGLYCGACVIRATVRKGDSQLLEQMAFGVAEYLGHPRPVKVKDLECEGCLSDVIAINCRECVLRDCVTSKGLTHCAECDDFPCQQLTDFNNDEYPHHSEVLDNIRHLREIGINAWIEEQEERWRCPNCGYAGDWYAEQCHKCGNALEGHF